MLFLIFFLWPIVCWCGKSPSAVLSSSPPPPPKRACVRVVSYLVLILLFHVSCLIVCYSGDGKLSVFNFKRRKLKQQSDPNECDLLCAAIIKVGNGLLFYLLFICSDIASCVLVIVSFHHNWSFSYAMVCYRWCRSCTYLFVVCICDLSFFFFFFFLLLQGGSKVACGTGDGSFHVYSWGEWGDISDRVPVDADSSIDACVAVDDRTLCLGSVSGSVQYVLISAHSFF